MDESFEQFVRNAFTKLQVSVDNITSRQTDLEHRYGKLNSVVDKHDGQVSELTKYAEFNTVQVDDLKKENHKLSANLKVADSRINQLTTELKKANASAKNLEKLCMDLQKEMRAEKETDPFKNVDNCLIILGLPEKQNEVLNTECAKLIASLNLERAAKVVKAARIPSRRPGEPGLVKLALQSRYEKVDILRAKIQLIDHV